MIGRLISALIAGALFGVGLVISRMSDPRVVLGFLDVTGAFNPALLFVLGGAVGVTVLLFRFVLKQPKPLLDSRFQLPTNRSIDARLLIGASIFGIGWGLAGYCPGPALVALSGGVTEALYFVPAMVVGGILYRALALPWTPKP
jgi:uncharacterized membrane protein YedE/YeeE